MIGKTTAENICSKVDFPASPIVQISLWESEDSVFDFALIFASQELDLSLPRVKNFTFSQIILHPPISGKISFLSAILNLPNVI
jgi:hypothetical protein